MTPAENAALDVVTLRRERRGKFVLYSELSADSNKEWLIDGLLGHAEMSVVYGHPGSGKSVFVEDAALKIAAGVEVHGRPVRRGAVLYVALERRKLVERRAIAFRIKHGLADLPFAIAGGVIDLRETANAQALVAVAKEVEAETGEPVVLVIIDTLSRALAGGDENSPKDMGAIVKASGVIGQGTGAHVMFIHHMPKESESMRGHGALLGAADTTILVTKLATSRTAAVVKANDSEEGAQLAFTLESVTVGADGQTTAPVVVPAEATVQLEPPPEERLSPNQRTMFTLLHEAGPVGLTTDDWNAKAREAGIGTRRAATLVDLRSALKSRGLVNCYGERWTVRH